MSQFSEIASFLSNLKDDLRGLDSTYQFLQTVQRTYSPAPIVEIITILKHEKPIIFSFLKQRVKNNISLSMMIDANIDYNLAKKRLGLE
jgi:hypothetical protein